MRKTRLTILVGSKSVENFSESKIHIARLKSQAYTNLIRLAWNVMSETLEQFVIRRRGELDEEGLRLQAALRIVEAEREKIDRVAMMLGSEPEPNHHGDEAEPIYRTAHSRSPKRASEATIKQMVLEILKPPSQGGTALEILEAINSKLDVPYPRTSLSPQLSRLKAEGKIHREGRLWKLGEGQDTGSDDFEELGSAGQTTRVEPADQGDPLRVSYQPQN